MEFITEFEKCHKKIRNWLMNGLKENEIISLPNELLLTETCDKPTAAKKKTTKSNKTTKAGSIKPKKS